MFGLPRIANLAKELKKIPSPLVCNKALVGGAWKSTTQKLSVVHPGNGEHLLDIANCGKNETLDAINVAHEAFPAWAAKTPKERAAICLKWGKLLEENHAALARLLTLENGKPFAESMGEMYYAISFFDWFAAEARRMT